MIVDKNNEICWLKLIKTEQNWSIAILITAVDGGIAADDPVLLPSWPRNRNRKIGVWRPNLDCDSFAENQESE